MKKTKRNKSSSVKVSDDLLAQLRAMADEKGPTLTWLLNKAVSQYLANEREIKP